MTLSISHVRLADIAEVNPPLPLNLPDDAIVSFVSMSGLSDDTASTTAGEDRRFVEVKKGYTPFTRGDLLVAKITPCFENGKIGEAATARDVGFGSTEFHVVRPNASEVDYRYLLHFLRQKKVRRDGERKMTGSAGQRRVPEHFLAELRVPLPPLPEQRRIATILDQADALRAKRRTALNQLHKLSTSIFTQKFVVDADPRWRMTTVRDVAAAEPASIRTGPFGSQLLHSEFVDAGVAVIGIDNAVTNEFRWAEPRFISEDKYQRLKRYTVKPGDVLITIMGTCGRCAVVPDDIPVAINTKHLCCISLDRQKCLPEFLHAYFLEHPTARRYLQQTAKGAIMSGLNMGLIEGMPIPLVPIELQLEFVQELKAISSMRKTCASSFERLDMLFSSTQHLAFRGEL